MPKTTRGTALFCSLGVLALLLGGACAHQGSPGPSADKQAAELSAPIAGAGAVLPNKLQGLSTRALPAQLVVPPSLVRISTVLGDQTEIRVGPGSQFELRDKLLPAGQGVLITAAIGPWRKVLTFGAPLGPTPTGKERPSQGWVHHRLLTATYPNPKPLPLNPEQLPVVVALRSIASLWSYPQKKRRPVTIAKGATFIALQRTKRTTLIWIAESNSLAWLANRDLR